MRNEKEGKEKDRERKWEKDKNKWETIKLGPWLDFVILYYTFCK